MKQKSPFRLMSALIGPTLLISVVLLAAFNWAQAADRTHRVGNIDITLNDVDLEWNEDYADNMEWPIGRGSRNRGMLSAWTKVIHIGEYVSLLGETASDGAFGGHLGEHTPVAGSFKKVVKRVPPTVTVNGEAMPTMLYDEVDPTMAADEKTVLEYTFAEAGFQVTRTTYAFANTDFDDFIIVDEVYEMTRDVTGDGSADYPAQTFNDVTFGFNLGVQISPAGNRALGMSDDDSDVLGSWTTYSGPESGRDITFTYIWDGDNTAVAGDDIGDPATATVVGTEQAVGPLGRFLSEAFVGYGPLQVSTAVNDLDGNDTAQPYSITRRTRLDVYGAPATVPAAAISSGDRDVTAFGADPSLEQVNQEYQGYGPFAEVNDGDQIRIVTFVGFGGISQELTISEGAKWLAGTLSDAQKNTLIYSGLDSLKVTADRAAWAWDNDLAVPAPPASPDLTIDNGPGTVELSWSDVSASEYRIYRADEDYYNVFSLVTTTTGLSYTDTDVTPGISYYYYVTAVGAGDDESSVSLNRTEGQSYAAIPYVPGANTAGGVVAVPNPFVISAGSYLWAENAGNTIKFFNLPATCTLKIYTQTGDLLQTISHTDGGDREDWNLRTNQNQYIVSGLYICFISDAKDGTGGAVDDDFTKFVVIR